MAWAKPKDTVKVDLATNKIIGFSKFEVGNVCVITGGKNIGRVGIIQVRDLPVLLRASVLSPSLRLSSHHAPPLY